jgi:hypothetical protein
MAKIAAKQKSLVSVVTLSILAQKCGQIGGSSPSLHDEELESSFSGLFSQ